MGSPNPPGGSALQPPLFTDENPANRPAAYAHNRPFATPGPYQTALAPAQEDSFRKWLKSNKVEFNPDDPQEVYDMRGFWQDTGGKAPGDFFTDRYKTPYDPTFSNESRYATPDNPFRWADSATLIDIRDGSKVFFNPSHYASESGGPPEAESIAPLDKYAQGGKVKLNALQEANFRAWAASEGVGITDDMRRMWLNPKGYDTGGLVDDTILPGNDKRVVNDPQYHPWHSGNFDQSIVDPWDTDNDDPLPAFDTGGTVGDDPDGEVFSYVRNNTGMRIHALPDQFGQDIEPWGRYMTGDGGEEIQNGWERGQVTFKHPLRVDASGDWKQNLSNRYGGKTGQELSDALLVDGYDGVVAEDKYGISEIVDIRPKDQRVYTVTEGDIDTGKGIAVEEPDEDIVRLYHRTSPEGADAIRRSGKFLTQEDQHAFFSTHPDGQAEGYGRSLVEIDVPKRLLDPEGSGFPGNYLSDEFPGGEQHWALRTDQIDPKWIRPEPEPVKPPEPPSTPKGYKQMPEREIKAPRSGPGATAAPESPSALSRVGRVAGPVLQGLGDAATAYGLVDQAAEQGIQDQLKQGHSFVQRGSVLGIPYGDVFQGPSAKAGDPSSGVVSRPLTPDELSKAPQPAPAPAPYNTAQIPQSTVDLAAQSGHPIPGTTPSPGIQIGEEVIVTHPNGPPTKHQLKRTGPSTYESPDTIPLGPGDQIFINGKRVK